MEKKYTTDDYEIMDKILSRIINTNTMIKEDIYFNYFNPNNKYDLVLLKLAEMSSELRKKNIYISGNFITRLWFLYQKVFHKKNYIWYLTRIQKDTPSRINDELVDDEDFLKLEDSLMKKGSNYDDIYNEYYNPKYLKKKYRKEKKNV